MHQSKMVLFYFWSSPILMYVFLKEDIFLTKILLSVESTGCIFGNKIFPGNVETLIKWNRVLESVVSLPKRGM